MRCLSYSCKFNSIHNEDEPKGFCRCETEIELDGCCRCQNWEPRND